MSCYKANISIIQSNSDNIINDLSCQCLTWIVNVKSQSYLSIIKCCMVVLLWPGLVTRTSLIITEDEQPELNLRYLSRNWDLPRNAGGCTGLLLQLKTFNFSLSCFASAEINWILLKHFHLCSKQSIINISAQQLNKFLALK